MEEQVKRTKGMLRLYGSYTREIQKLQKRLDEINEAIKWHSDWPEQAAKECGIYRLDPKHPAVQRMIIEQATLEDRYIIYLIFEEGYSYQAAAPMLNMSKSGIQHRIDAICGK